MDNYIQTNFSIKIESVGDKYQRPKHSNADRCLNKVGCEIIFTEIASGAKTNMVELDKLLSQIRKDDTLVVYKRLVPEVEKEDENKELEKKAILEEPYYKQGDIFDFRGFIPLRKLVLYNLNG